MTAGLAPDVLIGRSEKPLTPESKKKIALFCNLKVEEVISNPSCKSIYEIPLLLEKEKLGDIILRHFRLKPIKSDLRRWKGIVNQILTCKKEVKIAIPGKYTKLKDSYFSIIESLTHAGAKVGVHVSLVWIETEDFEKDLSRLKILEKVDGIIVPGGFGSRGVEGKILAIKYARTHKIPYLGLCYGMQLAMVEFARNVANLEDAHTTEIKPNAKHKIIDILPEKKDLKEMGGTLRLGLYGATLKEGTKIRALYGRAKIQERHRHRYEVNPKYVPILEKKGMVISGINTERGLVECIEIKDHPFFIGTQFHPEFTSAPGAPHPLFLGFVLAALEHANKD
jgi:CTP synthase